MWAQSNYTHTRTHAARLPSAYNANKLCGRRCGDAVICICVHKYVSVCVNTEKFTSSGVEASTCMCVCINVLICCKYTY